MHFTTNKVFTCGSEANYLHAKCVEKKSKAENYIGNMHLMNRTHDIQCDARYSQLKMAYSTTCNDDVFSRRGVKLNNSINIAFKRRLS